MIDTDKYEGHTPAPWKAAYDFPHHGQIQTGLRGPNGKSLGDENDEDGEIANGQLIVDAPLLLAEVKRLSKENNKIWLLIQELNEEINICIEEMKKND